MQNKGITLSNFLPFDCRCTAGLSLVRGMRQWYVFKKVLGGCVLQRSLNLHSILKDLHYIEGKTTSMFKSYGR